MLKKKPVNVLFLAATLPIGGAERTWIDFIPFLDKEKFNPVVLCFKEKSYFGEEMQRRGVTVIDRFMKSKYDLSVLWRLVRFMTNHDIQIVYTLDHDDAMFWGRIAARLARVPVCLTVNHTTYRRDGKDTMNSAGKLLMPLTDKIIATAQGSYDHLLAQGIPERKLHLIVNGVDIDGLLYKKSETNLKKSDFNIPCDAKVVGILATFKPEKAHVAVFLEAADMILKKCPNTYFLLVGDGVERPRIEQKMKKLGLEEHVIITGFREDASDILGVLDISTLASFPKVETFSLAILESMAVGLPIVVTDVGSLDEMVIDHENGYVVPPCNPEAFADAIVKILKDDRLAEDMGKKSQKFAIEKFHRNRMTTDTEALFDMLLRQKN